MTLIEELSFNMAEQYLRCKAKLNVSDPFKLEIEASILHGEVHAPE